MARPAVFFDRDGTLIEDADFLTSADEIRILPNAIPGLKRLHEAGYLIVVVTNQSGVARGYLTERELDKINDHLVEQVATLGGHVDAVFYCPHHPDGKIKKYARKCNCRKPLPGLFIQAREELDIDLQRSFAVGDGWRDVEAALAVGVPSVKLPRPAEREELPRPDLPLLAEAKDIDRAADIILSTSPEEARARLSDLQEAIERTSAEVPSSTLSPAEADQDDYEAPTPATAKVDERADENEGPLFDSSLDQSPLLVEEETLEEQEQEEEPAEEIEAEVEEPNQEAAKEQSQAELSEADVEKPMIETAAARAKQARPQAPAALECDRCGVAIDPVDAETGVAATFRDSLLCRECLPMVVRMAGAHAAGAPAAPLQNKPAAGQTSDEAIRELTVELRRLIRHSDTEPFGMPRIMGYIAQIGALMLGVTAAFQSPDEPLKIFAWLLAAVFVQLIALTMFVISSKRS